jgi:hypothetical protein
VTKFSFTGVVFSLVALSAGSAQAQSIAAQLGRLLTEQRTTTPVFVPDPVAATATFQTVAGLFGVELSTLPLASSSGGFVYKVNPALGLVERASDGFGPFFTERLLRNSRGQATLGFSFQVSDFTTLQGADLTSGTFPTNAARVTGITQPFAVDTLSLEMSGRSVTGFASYGVTDRLALSVVIPVAQVRFSGQRVRTVNGESELQSAEAGTATGLGDMTVQGRYVIAGETLRGFSVGADLKLPTGRSEDLLGSGDTAGRFIAIGSWEEGQLGVHANGGIGVGGATRELFWSTATTFAPLQRLTLVAEVMGRRLSELSLVRDVYQPHSVIPGIETMRWLPEDRGVHTAFFATGAKWNFAGSWLLNSSVLIRMTDAGLRARLTPSVSIDYAFHR